MSQHNHQELPTLSDFVLPLNENTLEYHTELNPAIFGDGDKMKPDVRNALLKVADNFVETLAPYITAGMVTDVCLTGSNANYNYTKGSDCDLHIMIQYPKTDAMYQDFALAKKTVWNSQYKVSIHGFPVEVYPQDNTESPVAGSGWYSVTKDQWIVEPVHQSNVDVANPAIATIADKYAREIDFAIRYKTTDMTVLHRLGEKIWGLRDQAKNGEFSLHNLAFKELRNRGYTDKFIKYSQEVQAKDLSIT